MVYKKQTKSARLTRMNYSRIQTNKKKQNKTHKEKQSTAATRKHDGGNLQGSTEGTAGNLRNLET